MRQVEFNNFLDLINEQVRYIRGIMSNFEDDRNISMECQEIIDTYQMGLGSLELIFELPTIDRENKSEEYSIVKIDDIIDDINDFDVIDLFDYEEGYEEEIKELQDWKNEFVAQVDDLMDNLTKNNVL